MARWVHVTKSYFRRLGCGGAAPGIDLVERFRLDAPLNSWDVRTFYGGGDHGYTDYPTLSQQGWR
jgi:hypothetical protein